MKTRKMAVAGLFYPSNPHTLQAQVDDLLAAANTPDPNLSASVRALVAPHAGYVYSGPIAASAYAHLKHRGDIERVVLLGPSHRVAFPGLALSSAAAFETPLRAIPVPADLTFQVGSLPSVSIIDEAHAEEHSLEVHLPFLQRVTPGIPVLPVVVGDAAPQDVANVIELAAGDAGTFVIISTDLSHFLDYHSARVLDGRTTEAIEQLSSTLRPEDACGCRPLNGLLAYAKSERLSVTTLDVRNSGDTVGSRDRVVGYGAYAVH